MPEFMGYDRAIVTFSPDGRLFQVEYAREAVKRGLTTLGLVFKNGVIIAAAHPRPSLSVSTSGNDKVHEIDNHIVAGITGFLADGRTLIDKGRVKAQVHKLTYDEPLDVAGQVKELSDMMQLYTQYGGVRPFGTAILVAGIDEKGPQLFELDPSATFYGWKAQAIGSGAENALKILKRKWKENLTEENAIKLALESLKAGEKGLKVTDIELAIVNENGFKKYQGIEGAKFIRKYF